MTSTKSLLASLNAAIQANWWCRPFKVTFEPQRTVDNADSGLPRIPELDLQESAWSTEIESDLRAVISHDWTLVHRSSQHLEALPQFLNNRRAHERAAWPGPDHHPTFRRPLRAPLNTSESSEQSPMALQTLNRRPLRAPLSTSASSEQSPMALQTLNRAPLSSGLDSVAVQSPARDPFARPRDAHALTAGESYSGLMISMSVSHYERLRHGPGGRVIGEIERPIREPATPSPRPRRPNREVLGPTTPSPRPRRPIREAPSLETPPPQPHTLSSSLRSSISGSQAYSTGSPSPRSPPNTSPERNDVSIEDQWALRRAYKRSLFEEAKTWRGYALEARLRSLIKLDSESDDQDVGPIDPERIDSDRNNYQYYARHRQERDPEKPFSVYGLPEIRDLDILRLWVNSNEHMYRTWPPGYTPLETDRDERDDESSLYTSDPSDSPWRSTGRRYQTP